MKKQTPEKYTTELDDLLLCFSRRLHVLHCKITHFLISKLILFQPSWGFPHCLSPGHLSVETLKAFSRVYFVVGVTLCCLPSAFFFMRGGDGLQYQWKPGNNDVLITSVLTHEGVLSAVRIPLCWWVMCLWSLPCCCTLSRRGGLVMRSWGFREVTLLLLKRFKNGFVKAS